MLEMYAGQLQSHRTRESASNKSLQSPNVSSLSTEIVARLSLTRPDTLAVFREGKAKSVQVACLPATCQVGHLIGRSGRLCNAFAGLAISPRISPAPYSDVSSFECTEPNGLSSMRRTRMGAGPTWK